jgi:hypothetical protein
MSSTGTARPNSKVRISAKSSAFILRNKVRKAWTLESRILLSDSKSKSNACSRTTEECKLIPPDARIGLGSFRKGYPTVRAAHEVSTRRHLRLHAATLT